MVLRAPSARHHAGMSEPVVLTIPRRPRVVEDVRCACRDCGAHLMGWRGYTLSGNCGNCGSYDVQPLADVPPAYPVAAAA